MSMNLSIYVGPYCVVPKQFDFSPWDDLVTDGRMEAGVDEKERVLIPNKKLKGVDRQLSFYRFKDVPVTEITPATIVQEKAAFGRLVAQMLHECEALDIPVREGWGILPRWS